VSIDGRRLALCRYELAVWHARMIGHVNDHGEIDRGVDRPAGDHQRQGEKNSPHI